MSVNPSPRRLTKQLLSSVRALLDVELAQYATFTQQIQTRICGAVRWQTDAQQLKENQLTATIRQLQQQIEQLKDENDSLRKHQMATLMELEDAVSGQQVLLWQNQKKEDRIQELFSEVESFKRYIEQLKDTQSRAIVSFDDSPIRIEELEVIREVSEHDMSMTVSMQSLQSQILEEEPSLKSSNETFTTYQMKNIEQDNENRPGLENCPIDNYKDALKILKDYNCRDADSEDNKPISTHTQPLSPKTKKTEKKNRCGAISKIKKLRKIQNLSTDTPSFLNSTKSDLLSKNHNAGQSEEKDAVSLSQTFTSHSSTTLQSHPRSMRSTSQIISLQSPVSAVSLILHQIAAVLAHPLHRKVIKDSLCKIHYPEGLQYQGRSNDKGVPAGYGKLTKRGQILYQGEWREGKMHGWGKLILIPPQSSSERVVIEVDGNFRCGVIDGTTMCIFNTGERFMGMMRQGQIEHEGTFVAEKGIFTGYWEESRLIFLI